MAVKKILAVPKPILRQKSKPVKRFDTKVRQLVADLIDTAKAAKEPEGVGLSAIQIGQPKRVFVIKEGDRFVPFINPQITQQSKKTIHQSLKKDELFLEGCLSVPGYYGLVDRSYRITLQWQDLAGKTHQKKFQGKQASYIQHELDHVNGILFIDHVLAQKNKLYQIKKDAEGKDIFYEVDL